METRTAVYYATRVLVATVLVVLAAACGGDGPTPPPQPVSLSITPSTEVRLYAIGETVQLSATPLDAAGNPMSAEVQWTSDNTAVATVDATGLVRATGFGTTKVRATSGSAIKEVTVIVRQQQFNANARSACSNPDMRNYKVEAQSAHLLIVSGTDNPPGGFTTAHYEAFAATFESLVWPVVTANFGAPADIDGNGKVIAFFTRAVNELTPQNSNSVVGGFFFGRDLFPKISNSRLDGCAGSNEAEMFYMLVPDPNGVVNGNVRTLEQVRRLTMGVIAHEFQHLINASRRLYVNQSTPFNWETTYMEEGLSHIAEELVFYEASGDLLPKMNVGIEALRQSPTRLDAFNAYMISNASRLSAYLREPSINSPIQRDDDLATRGAIWSFLRYLSDRGVPGAAHVEPACPAAPVLSTVGAQCRAEGTAAAELNVSAGGSAGEFAIVAFAGDIPSVSATQAGSITTTATATGAIPVTGTPTPWIASAGAMTSSSGGASLGGGIATLTLDYSFHGKLREMERRELPRRAPGARAAYMMKDRSSARFSVGPGSPLMAHVPVEPVWAQLVNSGDTGIVNLRGRFGQDIHGAMQDWSVANYVDDTGLPAPAQHTHPSWNFRSVLPALNSNGAVGTTPGTYPLQVHALTSSVTQTMVDGGATYYRFGIPAGGTSTVRFTVAGNGTLANLKLVIVRTQ